MIQEHEIVLYQVEDTNICVNVVFKDETFWMTQKAMAELFDVNVPAISKHLSNTALASFPSLNSIPHDRPIPLISILSEILFR